MQAGPRQRCRRGCHPRPSRRSQAPRVGRWLGGRARSHARFDRPRAMTEARAITEAQREETEAKSAAQRVAAPPLLLNPLPLSLQKWRTTRGSRWKHSSQGRVLAVTPMRRTSLWRRRRRRRCLRLCCRCAMLRHAVDIGLRHRILGALAGGVSGRSVRRAVRRRPVPSYSKEVSDPTESRQRGPSPRSCWRQMSCLDG